ncbi:MAG: hypothetical protein R3F34_15570 [Planctomycetota bacterium]
MLRRLLVIAALPVLAGTATAVQDQDVLGGRDWRMNRKGNTESFYDGDDIAFITQGPEMVGNGRRVSASWAILWWGDQPRYFGGEVIRSPKQDDAKRSLLEQYPEKLRELLNSDDLVNVRELYLEGPIEYYEGDRRIFYADALYLDRVDGHGWVVGARYSVKERIGGSSYVFKVDAKWLRISADGTIRSNDARITTSEFAEPTYTIETGNLEMLPTGDPETPWRVSMRDNKIRFGSWFVLPLPPLSYLADEDGEPTFGGLRVGDEARFGTVVGVSYDRDVREDFGHSLNRWLGGDELDYRSRFRVDATYLGSRGLLLDLGTRLSSPGHYRWDIDLAGLPDGDEDKGLARVPEDDRGLWRLWFRSRGRFDLGPGEYLDLAVTRQTDPGVQAEFFEDEYLEYEERESYLHWRRVNGNSLLSVTASTTLDPFRSVVERVPEVRLVNERLEVTRVFGLPVLYRNEQRLGMLSRVEGDPVYEPEFADGFGEVNTLRAVSDHRFEMPIHLGYGGLRAIPRIDASATGWGSDGAEDEGVGRALASAAVRFTSSYWRGAPRESLVELAPWIEARSTVVEETSSALPAVFDPDVELRQTGDFVEFGVHGRWTIADGPFELDGELRRTWADDPDGAGEDRWLPFAVLGSIASDYGPVPWRIEHDARYDTSAGYTRYSRTAVVLYPRRDLDVDVTFTMGRDETFTKLFEAVTVGALYRFTPKWDVYGRNSWSLLGDGSLASSVGIRRYGHDFLFEIEVRKRSGEGTSIGLGVKPLFSARKRPQRRLAGYAGV